MSQYIKSSNLGSSGLKVSNFIFGCMSFGSKEWTEWVEDDEEKIFEMLKTAYDLGIRTYDTADVYSNGLSEVILGKFFKKYNIPRKKVIIMTKVYFTQDEDYGNRALMFPQLLNEQEKMDLVNDNGLSRKHIFDAVNGSLKRLDLEYIDVYQIHRYDHSTPPEETMKALNDLIELGKIRYIGASSMKVVDLMNLQFVAERNNWAKFINIQSEYSLLTRGDEDELNYYANKFGVGLTPYSPLSYGFLARELAKNIDSLPTARAQFSLSYTTVYTEETSKESDKQIIRRVAELAEKYSTTRAAVALAWLLSKGAKPIVGISKVERLDDLVKANNLELSEEDITYLEETYETKPRSFFG